MVVSISGAQIMGGTHATPDEIAWVNMAYLMVKLTTFPLAA
jgi:MFS transporter, DHA2 family, multidrug resistance protein